MEILLGECGIGIMEWIEKGICLALLKEAGRRALRRNRWMEFVYYLQKEQIIDKGVFSTNVQVAGAF